MSVYPRLIKTFENTAAYFHCDSALKVQWFYNERKIPFSNVIQVHNNLLFYRSTLDNGGEYSCYGIDPRLKFYFISKVYYIVIGEF